MRIPVLLSATLALTATSLTSQTPAPPSDIDRHVAQVMREFEVPGMSLAVVRDGRVVLAKGYGVKALGSPAAVDVRTRFGIASNTKAFTATALALLVEEGKLEWDAPAIRYLPNFALYDPFVTRELTVRDLLVHRSGLGLGAGDLLWWPESTYDRKEIARRLRYIKPATSFRSAYAYDNVLYLVAGEVIETVSGKSWEDFVSSRILSKVGMTNSNVRHSDAVSGDNVAQPHASVEGTVKKVAPFASDNTNPAGGINSGAEDMAKWMMVQLDSGRLADGTRLFRPTTTRELWSLVTPISPGDLPPELRALQSSFVGYGLGFFISDYRGRKLLSHTGGLPGYLSKVVMIPGLRLGIAVLTNQESGYAFNAIRNRVLDHYLGASPAIDYVRVYKRLEQEGLASVAGAEKRAAAKRDLNCRSVAVARELRRDVLRPLVRRRNHHARGRQARNAIHAHSSPRGRFTHWQHDTFLARWLDRELRADAFVTFPLNPDGSIDQMKMQAASPSVDFSFDFQDLLFKPKAASAR